MASLEKLAEKYSSRNTLSDEGKGVYTPTGMTILDAILSDGKGVPNSCWIQLTSGSGCGKTHIVLTLARTMCKKGKKVVYIDSEKGVNESQMKGIGILPYYNKTFFLYPIATFEEAEEIMTGCMEDEEVALVIIDSLTALMPQKMLEKECTSAEPGVQARAMSVFIQKWRILFSKTSHQPTVFNVNQERTKISFVATNVGEAGGLAQQYYHDIRLRMRKKSALTKTVQTTEGKQSVEYGAENELWATKNRHAAPFVKGIITVIFGKGVSNLAAYQRKLMSDKVLTMAGAGFWTLSLPDMEPQKARGSDGVTELIKRNLPAVKEYVDSHGGFSLVKTEGKEES